MVPVDDGSDRKEARLLRIVDSPRSVQEVKNVFAAAAARRRYVILAVHNLQLKLNQKGVAFDRQCRVFVLCNPNQAKKALSENMAMSTVLPCRISVYRENGRTKIAALRPTALAAFFGDSRLLASLSQDIESALFAIMDDVAGPLR